MSKPESAIPHRTPLGNEALVIGGSIAGLLAARALAPFFNRVTILERGTIEDSLEPRKEIPQALHTHALLHGGAEVVKGFFPGMELDVGSSGTFPTDAASELNWYQYGRWKRRFRSGIKLYWCNRVKLELAIRRRVGSIPNVRTLHQRRVTDLVADERASRILGLEVEDLEAGGGPQTLLADFVVDASGRGSTTARQLEKLGYPPVEQRRFKIDVGYASRLYWMSPRLKESWKAFAIHPKAPHTRRMGTLYPFGEGKIMVTLGGWGGDHDFADEESFLSFARSLPTPDIHDCIRECESAGPIHLYKFPNNLWRRYDKMPTWPDGFVVLGDAVCSFNPIYGQGMTVSAFDAKALSETFEELRRTGRDVHARGFTKRFQKRVSRIILTPWMLAAVEDFRFRETEGDPPPGLGLLLWYIEKLYELSEHHEGVHQRFIEVLAFVKGPWSVFHPGVLWNVLKQEARDALASG